MPLNEDLVPVRNPANGSIAYVGAEYADVLVDDHDPAWEHVDVEEAAEEVGQVPQLPARNASQEEWAAYAVTQGADPGEAAETSRQDLIDTYGG